jgi:hypothetical protein
VHFKINKTTVLQPYNDGTFRFRGRMKVNLYKRVRKRSSSHFPYPPSDQMHWKDEMVQYLFFSNFTMTQYKNNMAGEYNIRLVTNAFFEIESSDSANNFNRLEWIVSYNSRSFRS